MENAMAKTNPDGREQNIARQLQQAVNLSSSLERDFGFDSLGWVELNHRVESPFGVTLADKTYATVETVEDLLKALLSNQSNKLGFDHRVLAPMPELEIEEMPHHEKTLVDVLQWHLQRHLQFKGHHRQYRRRYYRFAFRRNCFGTAKYSA
jgi:acyl carrier protein